MKKIRIISLVLAIICFGIFGATVFIKDREKIIENKEINEYEISEKVEETINKEDKVGINTIIEKITKYTKCNHVVIENINVDNSLINKKYNETQNYFSNYNIIEFNKEKVLLMKEINTYCPEHYILKELDGRIAIYTQIDEEEIDLYEILDVDINKLRENDKSLFANNGLKIYGRKNLYGIIEDFNS